MRVVDQEGTEIQDPDLSAGYLKDDMVLIEHHEAVEAVEPVYENQLVAEYDNGGRLYKRVLVTPGTPGSEAWDEYESVLVYVPYTEEELREIQDAADAEEAARAEATASSMAAARMDMAMRTMASMSFSTLDLSEVSTSVVANMSPLYPEWDPNGVSYKKGSPFTYTVDGAVRYFRASQDTVSTSTYKPGDAGTESIYYEFFIAPDGYEVYQPCKGEYNAYSCGDVVHYPDADSPLYESLVAGSNSNAYDPSTVPANWKKLEK